MARLPAAAAGARAPAENASKPRASLVLPALHRPFEMSWDSQVLTCRNATGESRIPWSDFVRWKESERLFLLYVSDVLFQLVPKQIFPNQDAVTAFRRVLAEHIVAR